MILVGALLWYYLATDMSAPGLGAQRIGGYDAQLACERQAEFSARTNYSIIVHLFSARKTKDGQYQRACFQDSALPALPTVHTWWFMSASFAPNGNGVRVVEHGDFASEPECAEAMTWLAKDDTIRTRGCWTKAQAAPLSYPAKAH